MANFISKTERSAISKRNMRQNAGMEKKDSLCNSLASKGNNQQKKSESDH